MNCIQCNKELIGKQKRFCSDKCKGMNNRNQSGYKERIDKYRKEWLIKNREYDLEYHRQWEHKNYQKRKIKNDKWKLKNPNYHRDYHKRPKAIERETQYRKTERYKIMNKKRIERWRKKHPTRNIDERIKNPERFRGYERKYIKTEKGKLKGIRIRDRNSKRNKYYFGKKYDEPTKEMIKTLEERDSKCVYCHCEFDSSNFNNPKYPTFDHLNSELPLIEINAVRACSRCNSSKSDSEVLEWCKKKGYVPNDIVYQLLNKQILDSLPITKCI